MLRRGLIVGAMIAALLGIAGYFNLVPGGRDLLTLYDRARGTFKDPNVLGAFLILPALFVLQSVVSDRLGKSFRSSIAFVIMALAILLAFSRAAWGGLVITSAFMLALMVLTSNSHRAAQPHHRDGAGRRHARGGAGCGAAVVRHGRGDVQAARQPRSGLRRRPLRPVRPPHPRRGHGARPAVRHRPAAVQPLFSGRHPQLVPERLHVRRLARRHLLSRADFHHRDRRLPLHLRARALAEDVSRHLRRLPRHRRREFHHRHRPLAALLDDAGLHVGHVRRRAALAARSRRS